MKQGVIHVPAASLECLDTISVASDVWRIPTFRPGEIPETRSVRLYRLTRVTGRVRGEGGPAPLDPMTVSLVALGVGLEEYGRPDRKTPDPWNPQWLLARRVQRHDRLAAPDRDGLFDVRVPRIRGMVLRATAPGWRATWARIPSDVDEFAVELTLRVGYSVAGRVLGEDGAPVAGLRVVAYVSQFGSYDGIHYEQLPLAGHEGYTGWWYQQGNRAGVNYMEAASIDEEGRFVPQLKTDGHVLLGRTLPIAVARRRKSAG